MTDEPENTEENGHRTPDGKFAAGNPGKPKGARHKLSEAFLHDMQADWETHGPAVIEAVRTEKPDAYLKVVASLLPRDLNVNMNPVQEATDDELVQRLRDLDAIIRPFLSSEGGGGDPGRDRPPTAH